MDGIGEDCFFLSNGHISPVWYATLARTGYFDIKELSTFRLINSRLQGHPATHEGLPGIRVASGSLGQGLSVACGAALTKKANKDASLIYILMGDGELDEGQVWEGVMFAAAKKIDNLIATIDVNGQQIDGATKDVEKEVSLNTPPGVSLLSNLTVTVKIKIEPTQGARTITRKVEISGIPTNRTAVTSPETVDLVLSGSLPTLNSLKSEDVHVVIDLREIKDLKLGVIQLEPKVTGLPEGITSQSLQPAVVQVEIK